MPKRSAISYFDKSFSAGPIEETLFSFCERNNNALMESDSRINTPSAFIAEECIEEFSAFSA